MGKNWYGGPKDRQLPTSPRSEKKECHPPMELSVCMQFTWGDHPSRRVETNPSHNPKNNRNVHDRWGEEDGKSERVSLKWWKSKLRYAVVVDVSII